jgi:nitroreductase
VPKALIEEIIGLAMRSPSSINVQPWNFYVITGEPLDKIRAGNIERNLAGVPQSREFRIGEAPFAGKNRDRQVGVAKQLFSAMGAARDDKDGRQDGVMRGFRPFDAPARIIVTYDRDLHGMDDAPFDCGAPPWSTPPGREIWAQWSTARASCARPSCARSPASPTTR